MKGSLLVPSFLLCLHMYRTQAASGCLLLVYKGKNDASTDQISSLT